MLTLTQRLPAWEADDEPVDADYVDESGAPSDGEPAPISDVEWLLDEALRLWPLGADPFTPEALAGTVLRDAWALVFDAHHTSVADYVADPASPFSVEVLAATRCKIVRRTPLSIGLGAIATDYLRHDTDAGRFAARLLENAADDVDGLNADNAEEFAAELANYRAA